jgi:hypothetical protein
MPEMTGIDLAAGVLTMRALHRVTDQAVAIGIRAFETKPLTKEGDSATIRMVLDKSCTRRAFSIGNRSLDPLKWANATFA